MKIIVLIKEVPDMDKVKFDSVEGRVNRSSAEADINPFDLYAIQAALDLKVNDDDRITVITMGPPGAEHTLRDCWARGADNLVLLSDRAFSGSDTFATAKALSTAISTLSYDLILCGEKTVDGDTAQVGAETAELLGIPHSYYVDGIESLQDSSVTVRVSGIGGAVQIRRMKLPALISVDKTISTPMLPTLDRKLESLQQEIKKINLNDLNGKLTSEFVGTKGSPTSVTKVIIPQTEERDSMIFKDDFNEFTAVVKDCLEGVSRT